MTAPVTTSGLTTTKKRIKAVKSPSFSKLPVLKSVWVDSQWICFRLEDGREVNVPLIWSEKLAKATPEQRNNVIVSDLFAFWDDIDEIIGVENILYGNRLYKPHSKNK